jgi:hypothetical protein
MNVAAYTVEKRIMATTGVKNGHSHPRVTPNHDTLTLDEVCKNL